MPNFWSRCAPFLAQVGPLERRKKAGGAGMPTFWRRWALFLVQVGFLVRDLRRKMGFCALQWRRSRHFFLTCAKNHRHLRQHVPTPAPKSPLTCAKTIDN